MFIAISLFVSVHFLLRLPLVQLWRQGNFTNPRWTLSMPLIAISEYGVPDKDQATLLMTLHFSSVECVVRQEKKFHNLVPFISQIRQFLE